MTVSAEATRYTFNNDEPTAGDLLDLLAVILDDFSREGLRQAGVRPGARCLGVGAGVGALAHWTADQVGPEGSVLATDLKRQHIRPHDRVAVRAHNVRTDPMPEGEFDVIHAWLLLAHLPQRREVLRRFIAARGTPGCLLPVITTREIQDRLVDAGMTVDDLDEMRALLVDPRLVIQHNLMFSTIGRRLG